MGKRLCLLDAKINNPPSLEVPTLLEKKHMVTLLLRAWSMGMDSTTEVYPIFRETGNFVTLFH